MLIMFSIRLLDPVDFLPLDPGSVSEIRDGGKIRIQDPE